MQIIIFYLKEISSEVSISQVRIHFGILGYAGLGNFLGKWIITNFNIGQASLKQGSPQEISLMNQAVWIR